MEGETCYCLLIELCGILRKTNFVSPDGERKRLLILIKMHDTRLLSLRGERERERLFMGGGVL